MLAIYIQVLANEVHWQIHLISVATTQHNSGRPNVLLFTFKYWLMKSINRFSFSQLQPHNSRPNVLAWKFHAIYMMWWPFQILVHEARASPLAQEAPGAQSDTYLHLMEFISQKTFWSQNVLTADCCHLQWYMVYSVCWLSVGDSSVIQPSQKRFVKFLVNF